MRLPTEVFYLMLAGAVMLLVIGGLSYISHRYSLGGIKSRTVGDGQHGTARFATRKDTRRVYSHIHFKPWLWRCGRELPECQGIIVGSEAQKGAITALVDEGDVHVMMIAASGADKTA